MKDYLIWVAENMGKEYGLTMERWMEYITDDVIKIPAKYSIEEYIKINK